MAAAHSREKATLLATANTQLDSLRYLLRLSKDLRLISLDSYEYSAGCSEEIGRMLGGWKKQVSERTKEADSR